MWTQRPRSQTAERLRAQPSCPPPRGNLAPVGSPGPHTPTSRLLGLVDLLSLRYLGLGPPTVLQPAHRPACVLVQTGGSELPSARLGAQRDGRTLRPAASLGSHL